jgi:hypothetical protein
MLINGKRKKGDIMILKNKTLKMLSLSFTLAFLTACSSPQPSTPIPPEEPVETPVETPVEVPEEEPVETPVEEAKPVITTETITEEAEIPFTTEKKNDESLEKGKTSVSQKGVPGVEVITFEVTKTDGVETERKEVKREVKVSPVKEVVKVGVKVVASAPAPAPKPNPTPAPTTPKPAPTPAPDDEDIPEDELIEIPEPPAPPTEFTPDPAYGTTSLSLPNGNYKVWQWKSANVFYVGKLMDNGMWSWGWGYGGGMIGPARIEEWYKYAKEAFPKPSRDPAYEGEEVSQKVWVWLP